MLNELQKNGLSVNILRELSYESKMGKSLVNSLRKFEKEALFEEVSEMIRFYQEAEVLDNVDLDYRVKSEDSCIRKYNKFYPEMRLEKVFNGILGFRMLVDNYNSLLEGKIPEEVRIVDMSHGKALADFTEKLQRQMGQNGVQLVTISRPSAYGEYEPYEIIENKEKFQERILTL